MPRQENVPLTIDAQYVVGFNWERQATAPGRQGLRRPQDLGRVFDRGAADTVRQSPGTTASRALPGPDRASAAARSKTPSAGVECQFHPGVQRQLAPDIIAKIAADPGWGHYELYGLLRFLDGRVSFAATGTGKNYKTTGEGIGGGMILPLVPKLLDFQVSGLIGQGVGRYGTSQLPDATFSPTGKIEPLSNYSIMGGFVGHPIPAVDIYAYGGAEGVGNKTFGGTFGYGNPNTNLSGCTAELGSCAAVTSAIVEGTIGAWWRVIQSNYGTVQIGAQYEYVDRNTFRASGREGQHAVSCPPTRTCSCSVCGICRSSKDGTEATFGSRSLWTLF